MQVKGRMRRTQKNEVECRHASPGIYAYELGVTSGSCRDWLKYLQDKLKSLTAYPPSFSHSFIPDVFAEVYLSQALLWPLGYDS